MARTPLRSKREMDHPSLTSAIRTIAAPDPAQGYTLDRIESMTITSTRCCEQQTTRLRQAPKLRRTGTPAALRMNLFEFDAPNGGGRRHRNSIAPPPSRFDLPYHALSPKVIETGMNLTGANQLICRHRRPSRCVSNPGRIHMLHRLSAHFEKHIPQQDSCFSAGPPFSTCVTQEPDSRFGVVSLVHFPARSPVHRDAHIRPGDVPLSPGGSSPTRLTVATRHSHARPWASPVCDATTSPSRD